MRFKPPTPVDGKAIKWDVFYALWLLFPFRIALVQIAISGKWGIRARLGQSNLNTYSGRPAVSSDDSIAKRLSQ